VLTGNAFVTGDLVLTNGHITLGSNNLSLSGPANSGSLASHVITNGTGNLILVNVAAGSSRIAPVSANATSYTPVVLTANQGHTTDNFLVNVKEGVYMNGVSGSTFTSNVVDRTWNITEGTSGGSNVNLAFQWNSAHELTGFQRNRVVVIRHNGTSWIDGPVGMALGNDPFNFTIANMSSFGPFSLRTEPLPRPVTGIYPNPARTDLNVILDMPSDSPVTFSIFDAKGSLVMQTRNTVLAGLTRTTLNVEKLSSGVYVLKVSAGPNDEFIVQRFVKVP